MGRLPLTPRVKQVIEYADHLARELRSSECGTEHLLLAIARERDGTAADLLSALWLTPEVLTDDVLEAIRAKTARSQFTDRASRAMDLAIEEAKRLNHGHIETEHILLGLMSEGSGVAANALKILDLDLSKLRAEVEKVAKPREQADSAANFSPGPRAAKAMEYAIDEEGRTLHQGYVGTEHMLLGLLREQDGVACQVLFNLGLTAEKVRQTVLELVGSEATALDSGSGASRVGQPQVYERFSDIARKVVAMANQEAIRFNHEYWGTEHLLLALVREGSGIGAKALKSFGLDLLRVQLEVEKLVESGPDPVTPGRLPQTPRAKKAIAYAIEESRNAKRANVGTGQLLVGLLREEDGTAAKVLMNLGISLAELREAVLGFEGAVD